VSESQRERRGSTNTAQGYRSLLGRCGLPAVSTDVKFEQCRWKRKFSLDRMRDASFGAVFI
jgi:hypothetical protein